jgi:hypothetical protein
MALAITISGGSHSLANGDGRKRLDSKNGFPVLDDHLQSNVPGLFFTSMCATQDFGPFFAFQSCGSNFGKTHWSRPARLRGHDDCGSSFADRLREGKLPRTNFRRALRCAVGSYFSRARSLESNLAERRNVLGSDSSRTRRAPSG